MRNVSLHAAYKNIHTHSFSFIFNTHKDSKFIFFWLVCTRPNELDANAAYSLLVLQLKKIQRVPCILLNACHANSISPRNAIATAHTHIHTHCTREKCHNFRTTETKKKAKMKQSISRKMFFFFLHFFCLHLRNNN